MKRLLILVADAWYYGTVGWFVFRRLIGARDEVEIVCRTEGRSLMMFFDPVTVKDETRIVEELTYADGQGVGGDYISFRREGRVYKDTKDKAAYLA